VFATHSFFLTAVFSQSPPSLAQLQENLAREEVYLRASVDNLAVEFTETRSSVEGKPPVDTAVKLKACTPKRLMLVQRQRSDRPSVDGVQIRNPVYFATLDAVHPKQYAISSLDVEPWPSGDILTSGFTPRVIATAFAFNTFTTQDLFGQNFELQGSSWSEYDGKKCVKATWLWKPEKYPDGLRLDFVLSPDEHWAIREFRQGHPQGDTVVKMRYQLYQDKLVPANVIYEEYLSGSKEIDSRRTVKFNSPRSFDGTEEQFRLSYYGLPEPKARPARKMYLLVLGAIFGLGLFAYAVWKATR